MIRVSKSVSKELIGVFVPVKRVPQEVVFGAGEGSSFIGLDVALHQLIETRQNGLRPLRAHRCAQGFSDDRRLRGRGGFDG